MSSRADPVMTIVQLEQLVRLTCEHPTSTWHFNDCGCCICVHPEGREHNKTGYVINSDGDVSFHDTRADSLG